MQIRAIGSSGSYSEKETEAIDSFVAKITDKESTKLVSTAIVEFKSDIAKLTLSRDKIAFYENVFSTFDLLNKVDGVIYNTNVPVANMSRCLTNVIELCIAYGALFTIEVGSMGAATLFTVGGFVWASTTFGGGCN